MGLRDDLDRFKSIGEDNRQDLDEFIEHGDLGESHEDVVKIPIKVVSLPEFVYSDADSGGVGQAEREPEEGEPVDVDPDGDDGEGDEPGDDSGEHGYYEMDPEEFAERLDEELGLDLEPKGKRVIEEETGDFTDVARRGPDSTLDIDTLFKNGLKRKLALSFDEDYARSVLQVDGIGPDKAFEHLRSQNVQISKRWLEDAYDELDDVSVWESLEEHESNVSRTEPVEQIRRNGIDHVPFRREDEQYRHPEVVEKKQQNVVVVNIRDVSGSMGKTKRELVERVFTPMDWYLQGKYDNAEFIYIAHDSTAWEVDRSDFFGIKSGGGTKISSAYEVAQAMLDRDYPWSEWNRYVFAAGDGENTKDDTKENVIPLMEEIEANKHAYLQVQPSGRRRSWSGNHGDVVQSSLSSKDNVTVERISGTDDVVDAIINILSEGDTE